MSNRELYHYGILGMKWGRRRYQNKDGTLTAAGKKRYGTGEARTAPSNSYDNDVVSSMSDEDLKKAISRLENEKKYRELVESSSAKKTCSKGKSVINSVLGKPGKNIGSQLSSYVMAKGINALLKEDVIDYKAAYSDNKFSSNDNNKKEKKK